MRKLRIPAVLAVATIGCSGKPSVTDAKDTCLVFCVSSFTDAGVCPSPPVCIADDGTCPAGCRCDSYCVARTPEDEANCPSDGGFTCATADGSCPPGCEPAALG
jgi:hypothetical protein